MRAIVLAVIRRGFTAVLVAVVVTLAACGDDEADSVFTGSSSSTVDPGCQETNKEQDARTELPKGSCVDGARCAFGMGKSCGDGLTVRDWTRWSCSCTNGGWSCKEEKSAEELCTRR